MSSRFLATFIISAGLSLAPVLSPAQTSGGSSPQTTEEHLRAQRELDVKIQFCRQLMLGQNWAGAADMLETLYSSYPENVVVVSLLVQCYENLQLYDKSEEIIRRHLEREPDNFNFRLLYAEVLAKQGQFDRSAEAYRAASDGIALSNQVRYQAIVQSMVTHGLDDAALGFIDSLRVMMGDSTLFAIQRGTVLEQQRQYDVAAREFYSLLGDTTLLGNGAEKKLLDLLAFGESEPAAESYILSRPDLFQQPRALKILSTHYLKSGQYEKALQFTISQDSLGGFSGRNLENFMRSCFEHRLYEQAVRTGDYLFGRAETEGVRDDVYFIYGDALVRLGRYREAIDVYAGVFEITRQKRLQAEALYNIGKVLLDHLARYDSALVYFDSVMAYYGSTQPYLQAMLSRPKCYLRQGQLDRALAELEKIASRPLEGQFREQTLYDLALAYLFSGEIDSTKAALSRLMVETPRGMYVNDAVRLLFTLEQAQGSRQLLDLYAGALYFVERAMKDSAEARLDSITKADDHGLGDVALYELVRMKLSDSDTLGALGYIERLSQEYPDSYYLPYGLRIKADVYSLSDGKRVEAREIYRHLLENFPNFPFISDVRQRVRQLEESLGSS